MSKTLFLTELKPNQFGVLQRVEAVDGELERLMAMGVCEGRTVELVQAGDPLILKVYGTRIGISARLAARLRVEACNPASCRIEALESGEQAESP
ncbi:MAG: ferrous iron transport protein A [Verrucomicrobia bacterium]|nr:ferrous iron transport protein A [Kiritimatiellia bacterium]MCO6399961.1 ferrous iron transport protein A [Verrucomicrobiota bacterium]